MELQEQVSSIILQPESEILEYKAVLPPSKSIAQIICSFANTNGGLLILGVSEIGGLKASGLSEDFRATSITHKAIDLLSPRPVADYGYVEYNSKKLFAIRVEKSPVVISLEGKIFERRGDKVVQTNPTNNIFQAGGYDKISAINAILESLKSSTTGSKLRLLEHYQSVLKMIDNLKPLLYPENPSKFTTIKEGKVLSRILFSSVVDNFETYLSDILFEIYLAKPDTLKSEQMVKVEDVLNCSDIQDFITFWAKQKIGKLQKGSVKGFIADNKQIKDLNAINKSVQDDIERILQIRHLYSHRNGIVDDKFLKYFPVGYSYGTEHQMSIEEVLDKIEYLAGIIHKIDDAVIFKYNLSTL
ncbi:Divergent AAA domain protein [Mariniflexile rhizosphaerae]|uniref:AlbA family DNA-binding domain-containing protein n=1 Tax=unclassified Mariniflexile TaxID=2643887 RepID=UPI000E32E8BB|nr:ATP-binding protein [Mariniflexile sp. TRM1-10]AXP79717.1 Divergent AAA domain protein [Mariniflexile sp. TRM1-10]